MAKKKISKITKFSAYISLISFIYKLLLAFLSFSTVLFIASLSTLMIFIVKELYIKNINKTRKEKKKIYLFMTISIFVYAIIFISFVALKINGIDISNKKDYNDILGYILLSFMVISFILSIIKLKIALDKSDIMVIGFKQMSVICSITDLVIIEGFVYSMFLEELDFVLFKYINYFFPLIVGIIILIFTFIMFKRYKQYEV